MQSLSVTVHVILGLHVYIECKQTNNYTHAFLHVSSAGSRRRQMTMAACFYAAGNVGCSITGVFIPGLRSRLQHSQAPVTLQTHSQFSL